MRCNTCRDKKYVDAPPTNAWRLYFAKIGRPWQPVFVSCPACGGVMGDKNRRDLAARLAARKRAGTFPARIHQ
jgi:hypothetical protein